MQIAVYKSVGVSARSEIFFPKEGTTNESRGAKGASRGRSTNSSPRRANSAKEMKALSAGRIRPSKTKADSLLIFRYSFDLFFVGIPTAKLQSLAVTDDAGEFQCAERLFWTGQA